MLTTPKSLRLQIGLFGRTNVGKSSFLNMVAGQDVSITSEVPGTTTDVVEKVMELLPLGPVVFLDTGGLDDHSVLGAERIKKTNKVFNRSDIVILVVEPNIWTEFEDRVCDEAAARRIPCLIVVNKIDRESPSEVFLKDIGVKAKDVLLCASTDRSRRDEYLHPFKMKLAALCDGDYLKPPSLLEGLVPKGGLAVLIVPVDLEAPKGRLILPQVQTIRDALDNNAASVIVKETEYAALLKNFKNPPDIVVCDSQVVDRMVAETPADIPCTTFSILFARLKGDLVSMSRAVKAIDHLENGDRVLIAESCSHHAVEDDIGRVKIPRWLRTYSRKDVHIDVCAGRDFPEDLGTYRLVIQCGSCMLTRTETLNRIYLAEARSVPVTNYGVCISFLQGVLERVLAPFPEALTAYREASFDKKETSCSI